MKDIKTAWNQIDQNSHIKSVPKRGVGPAVSRSKHQTLIAVVGKANYEKYSKIDPKRNRYDY